MIYAIHQPLNNFSQVAFGNSEAAVSSPAVIVPSNSVLLEKPLSKPSGWQQLAKHLEYGTWGMIGSVAGQTFLGDVAPEVGEFVHQHGASNLITSITQNLTEGLLECGITAGTLMELSDVCLRNKAFSAKRLAKRVATCGALSGLTHFAVDGLGGHGHGNQPTEHLTHAESETLTAHEAHHPSDGDHTGHTHNEGPQYFNPLNKLTPAGITEGSLDLNVDSSPVSDVTETPEFTSCDHSGHSDTGSTTFAQKVKHALLFCVAPHSGLHAVKDNWPNTERDVDTNNVSAPTALTPTDLMAYGAELGDISTSNDTNVA